MMVMDMGATEVKVESVTCRDVNAMHAHDFGHS